MAENHDGNEGCKLPPDVDVEKPKGSREGGDDCYEDGKADEGHHAGAAIGEFVPCAAEEDAPTVEEDNCAQNGGDEL